ncbi:sodium:alanine symporter family protein, partial [bacterium]|nr:sodium:alanine symporter family protein [bacterium]
MDFYPFLVLLRDTLAFPVALLFLFVAVFLTIKTRFIQFRAGKKFIQLVTKGPESHGSDDIETINPFHALFTSMSTTIGMGNIIAPPLAIITGGPGALFWLVVYCFFASATKYVEVTLAVKFRSKAKDGAILGGPTEYLKKLNPFLGRSYGFITIFLFAAWAALQANSLGEIFSKHHVPTWATGVGLAILIFFVLKGGAKRVGIISSRLVPVMFVIYVSCSLFILLKDPSSLFNSVSLVLSCAFSPAATVGGFLGATVMAALRDGVARGVYITECGIGTSSVAHAVADVKKPTDQGVL